MAIKDFIPPLIIIKPCIYMESYHLYY